MEKTTQRRAMLDRLARVEPADRRGKGEQIAERVLSLPELERVGRLMLFLSMEDELDTDPLVEGALEAGLEIYAPRTFKKTRKLLPVRVTSLEAVVRGVYGIREPASDESAAPGELDAVAVPGVAFDRQGWRLGRGGGFYDRLIGGLPGGAVTVGVAYAMQIVDEVAREPHDEPVDLIVTEDETIRPAR